MPELVGPRGETPPDLATGHYRNGIPGWVLVHTANALVYPDGEGEWIEGEPGDGASEALQGAAFACVLFLPGPGGEQSDAFRPRVVRTPTLLYNPLRDDGTIVVLGFEDEVLVAAPELAPWTGAAAARWLVAGVPQPFGPPGTVIGVQATLRQVR